MRFYMSKKERDEIKGLIYSFEVILNDINSSTEEKQAAEYQIVSLSGILLSPLFPTGIFRNILMISFFALGFLAFLTPYEWLFWSFFIALAFSPRIVGELAYGYRKMVGGQGTLEQNGK